MGIRILAILWVLVMPMSGLSHISRALKQERAYPHLRFVPNGKQAELVHLREANNCKILGLSSGNGVGKSTIGIQMVVNLASAVKNRFFQHDFWQRPHGPKRIRIISSPKHIADDGRIQDLINEWFPRRWLENTRKDKLGYRHLFPDCDGWEVQVMSNRLETNEYAAKEVSWIWFDEPFRSSIFGENLARTRNGGHMLVTLTPITEPGAEASELGWIWEKMIDGDEYDAEFIFGGYEDNCRTHGKPGFLNHDELEAAIAGCDEEEYLARAHGIYKNMGGAVYPAWKNHKDKILIEPYDYALWHNFRSPPPTLYMCLDPHDAKPWAMLWVAAFADEHCEFVYEYPDKQDYHKTPRSTLTIEDYLDVIEKIECKFLPQRVRLRIIDKNYGNQERLAGDRRTTIKQDLIRISRKRGRPMRWMENPGGNAPWRNAKHIIHQLLTPSRATGLPQWRCFNTLKNLDYAMRHYTMQTRSGRQADIHGAILQKPAEKHKCFPNMIEWLAHLKPRWVEPEPLFEEIGAQDEGGHLSEYAQVVGYD